MTLEIRKWNKGGGTPDVSTNDITSYHCQNDPKQPGIANEFIYR